MKWLLICWAAPVSFLGAWYYLSYYDMSFGIFMLTRQMHDLVFEIYGKILGIPPETIPPLVARAIAFDSVLVFAIYGFRRRAAIIEWWCRRQASRSDKVALPSADSLSNAP
ncbi:MULTISPECIES: DUF6105 family protein [Rhizobium]|uniref:Uncharacterized protein n=1 Tax=Rhizobium miluonense TaxID=411945 RepID=A0A1C3UJA9_9HYPH|nr:DUF6105 family protein [Rhizobium miluonense]SCB15580.1 hypothetical protein GA0061102_100453 [Rhizobium miluonense]